MLIGNAMASEESDMTALEGAFGKVAVNVKAPGIIELWLREADGNLAAKNVLSLHPPMHDWAVGSYSYVVNVSGNRYESRRSTGHHVEQKDGKLALRSVKLVDAEGKAAPLAEDWEPGGQRGRHVVVAGVGLAGWVLEPVLSHSDSSHAMGGGQ